MRTTRQINTFWELARERSGEGEIVRRRIAALGAIAVVFCGFLLAVGLAVLVLVFLAGMLASVGIVAVVAAWPRVRRAVGSSLGDVRGRGRRAPGLVRPHARRVRRSIANAVAAAGARTSPVARRVVRAVLRLSRELGQTARATAIRFAPRPARIEPQREAIRLNATGTQHRRHGRYEEAVDCHRQALEILRELGDRRGVALTQSNLALALSHADDDEWAIGLFEEAAATLNELGDEEHEAQVMANLGLVHRRHGRREEGDNVLELALTKLSPASSAYHAIEEQLRRAS
jgi:hypothetical protein